MQVTANHIKAIGGARAKMSICVGIADGIAKYGSKVHLTHPMDLAHFLGQCATETGGFSTLTENLNYSANQLRRVWRRRFSPALARQCARNPEKIANVAYARPRMGNTSAGDGWKYRGRGGKQVTFKFNYRDFTKWCRRIDPSCPDFVADPDKLTEFPWAFLSAAWYWSAKGCYKYARRDDVRGLTKRINGGYNGLKQRVAFTTKAKRVLNMKNIPVAQRAAPRSPDALLKKYQEGLNQIALAKNNPAFSVGAADGWNGKRTRAAVAAFQRSVKSLGVDGKLGPATRASIDRVLARLNAPAKVAAKPAPQPLPPPDNSVKIAEPKPKTGLMGWFRK